MSNDERHRPLEEVAPLLGMAYAGWKDFEARKNTYKDEFFALADAAVADRGLAVKMIEVPGASEAQARERTERHYPEWLIDELRPHRTEDDVYEAILRENPALKPFSYTHDGVVYSRQISKGPVMLDDELLAAEDWRLYTQVTFELPWGDIIPIPVDQLPSDLIGQLTKYIYHGKPRASLAAPKPVKEGA